MRISLSAATAAAKSTWANGPRAFTGSARLYWILKCLRISATQVPSAAVSRVRIDSRWHFIGALVLAGVLSVYASFLGLMGFLSGSLPRHRFSAPLILLFLSPLLALPLFALAAASIRWAAFSLWALGPAYSLAMFQMSNSVGFTGSFTQYVGLLLACLFDRMAIMLWITAWLVFFGSRIYAKRDGGEPTAMIGQVK